ncbi:pre-mRNA-splicing factor ATP-dependent RNA helicase prp22 [Ephemerocybe angulata]|uniref:RNA helicase n=1 Tax=Ephemerocybe angulata TaxID=980116 RepID=A0A8H6MED9_9AGAR|nr:pre-mRNA-splicing factor ATP-dependent RNA helicase prp22 [Tulosesus angulatus]
MAPKKKKTQLKPVARGFATTSVPKKVLPPTEPPEDALENTPVSDIVSVEKQPDAGPSSKTGVVATSSVQAGESDERQASQSLVDKFQEKTEKEITRRNSKSLPRLDLDESFRNQIFELISESKRWDVPNTLDDWSEERVLTRLAITYGILRRLGFSEARVEECLQAIPGVELDEAYEWLAIHCPEDELYPDEKETFESRTPYTSTTRDSSLPQTPKTPTNALPVVSQPEQKRLDAGAPTFIPRSMQTPISESFSTESCEPETPPESTQSTPSPPTPVSASDTGSDDDHDLSDNDDPNVEYVRLKLKHYQMQTVQGLPPHHKKMRQLQQRISLLWGDSLFDERVAEEHFRTEKKKVDVSNLKNRLQNGPRHGAPKTPTRPRKQPTPTPQSSTSTPNAKKGLFDGDDDDAIGGVLDLLDAPSESTSDGRTILLREMNMPKHSSGRTPKNSLRECVHKQDKYAAITYNIISGESRAKRASVSISWEGKKRDEWAMDDVACPEEAQAEQYIATVALHALTFPQTDGFAAGIFSVGGTQTFFRSLPPAFRDLWDELEAKRRERDDEINRDIWAKLRSYATVKCEAASKRSGKVAKAPAPNSNPGDPTRFRGSRRFDPQLAESFAQRQASYLYQEMLEQRNTLPIAAYRDTIIQTLEESQVVVLSGETGCGKSTQVPSFIVEHCLSQGQPCRVYCTEPRRISAISLAQRVSRELGDAPNAVGTNSSLVGYSIRLESNISRNTRLAYVTNGIALRMLEGGSGNGGQGTAFDEITHIIIDEVHERSIESDFLLIVLKSLIRERPDLKVILMSATVDAEKISEYFGGCPTLHVPGRTFPVDVKFLEDAVEFTNWTVAEGSPYARRSNDKYYRGKNRPEWTEELVSRDDEDEDDSTASSLKEGVKLEKRYSQNTVSTLNLIDERLIPYDLITRMLEKICFEDPAYFSMSSAILIFLPGLGEIRRLHDILSDHPHFGSDAFKLYPLHSTLSSENQGAVFDIPPHGVRKIVISTNIAETGITIPDITCVIDTGKHKEMRFDEKRQISRLIETFISKSNAAQRRGRAGRVQRGLCFHLFTKIRHDTQMMDNPLPEMMRLSLSDLALRIKIMKVKLGTSIEDCAFTSARSSAISMLVEVRALTPSEDITPLGRLLSKLPTDVHLGKFLLIATSPFVTPLGMEQEADRAKNSFKIENSDFLTIHNAFSSWRRASSNPGVNIRKFCSQNYLSHQNLQQIEELRQQFLGFLVDTSFIQVDRSFIRDIGRARYARNRTRFVNVPPEYDVNSRNFALINAALVAGLYPKVLSIDSKNSGPQLRTITNNQSAFFHPSSVNFGRKPADFGVNYLAYFTLMHSKKLYAWETGPVEDLGMLLLCGESDFKLLSDTAVIDRKIKFNIPAKTNVALKLLREHLYDILSAQFRGQALTETHVLWNEVAQMVLGKIKPKDDKEQTSITFM